MAAADAQQDGTVTDERGVTLTAQGRQRARAKLADARAKHTPEYWAALRERLNLPKPA